MEKIWICLLIITTMISACGDSDNKHSDDQKVELGLTEADVDPNLFGTWKIKKEDYTITGSGATFLQQAVNLYITVSEGRIAVILTCNYSDFGHVAVPANIYTDRIEILAEAAGNGVTCQPTIETGTMYYKISDKNSLILTKDANGRSPARAKRVNNNLSDL